MVERRLGRGLDFFLSRSGSEAGAPEDEAPEPVGWRDRLALTREHLAAAVELRGELRAVRSMRRYYPGYLKALPSSATMRRGGRFSSRPPSPGRAGGSAVSSFTALPGSAGRW